MDPLALIVGLLAALTVPTGLSEALSFLRSRVHGARFTMFGENEPISDGYLANLEAIASSPAGLVKIEHNDPLEARIRVAALLGKKLNTLNAEINEIWTLRQAELLRLLHEAGAAQEQAALTQDTLRASQALVNSQLDALLRKRARGDRLFQILVATLSFAAGIGGTLILQSIAGHS